MGYNFPDAPAEGDEFTPPGAGQKYVFRSPRWLVAGVPPAGEGGGGGIGEAPEDGKQYVRQLAAWQVSDWSGIANKPLTFSPTLPIPQSGVTNLVTDLLLKAPVDSPVFTGNPQAPTAVATDDDTSIATTAFVQAAIINGGVPAGAIMAFARSDAPAGWLKANGSAVSRTSYAKLFAAIGTAFGTGDGSTTFNLPDLRGEFVRGFDDGKGVDVGRVLGTGQVDGIKTHIHPVAITSANNSADHTHPVSILSSTDTANHYHYFSANSGYFSSDHSHGVTGNTGGFSTNHTHAGTLNGRNYMEMVGGGGGQGTTGGGLGQVGNTNWADRDHSHYLSFQSGNVSANHYHGVSGNTGNVSAWHQHNVVGDTGGVSASHSHTVTGNATAALDAITETRPRNVALAYCIKT